MATAHWLRQSVQSVQNGCCNRTHDWIIITILFFRLALRMSTFNSSQVLTVFIESWAWMFCTSLDVALFCTFLTCLLYEFVHIIHQYHVHWCSLWLFWICQHACFIFFSSWSGMTDFIIMVVYFTNTPAYLARPTNHCLSYATPVLWALPKYTCHGW